MGDENKATGVDPKLFLDSLSTSSLLEELNRRVECGKKPAKRYILIGPPGSGKGTHAPRLAYEQCGLCHLSTGDILRNVVASGSDLGKKLKATMDSGGLVDDPTMIEVVKTGINNPKCTRGFILDGFPRTVAQAEKLDQMLGESKTKLDGVINFKVEDKLLVDRIVGRRVHPASGRSYHVKFAPPKVEGKDDITGEPLVHRSDDTAEALNKRLGKFHAETQPVINYYGTKGILSNINGDAPLAKVWEQVALATAAPKK